MRVPTIKAFQPRAYDPDRNDTRTDAQRAATDRNFAIFKLRGLWSQADMLNEPMRSGVRDLIDLDLRERGALPQEQHEIERRRKRNAKLKKENKVSLCNDCGEPLLECECIPF